MTKPLVAVLGSGSAGMHHLKALKSIGAIPIAVPTRDARRHQLASLGYRTAATLTEAGTLGAKLCVVATETDRHVSDAINGIQYGMHVLVEKPAASDLTGAMKILAESRRFARKVFVGCDLRFSRSLNRFKALLPTVGDLHAIQIECRSFLPDWRPGRDYRKTYSARASDGGVLRDLIHEVDYAGWIFGWPLRVYGCLGNTGRLRIASDEWANLSWRHARGASVQIGLDYLTRDARRCITADGAKGTIRWDGVTQMVTITIKGRRPRTERHSEDSDATFISQSHAFIKSALSGRKTNLATLSDGIRALAVCDATRHSSLSRREEMVARH